jgi:hypothetical protein
MSAERQATWQIVVWHEVCMIVLRSPTPTPDARFCEARSTDRGVDDPQPDAAGVDDSEEDKDMVIDDGGAIWLSNPWLAGAALSFAVGLVLWCHRWLETGKAPAPRNLHLRMMPMARRMSSAPEMTAPAPVRPIVRTRATSIGVRHRGSARIPQNAA